MKITCTSDLHGAQPNLPGGDLLIIAGDLTSNDSEVAWVDFLDWLEVQQYRKIVLIAGNHDNSLQGAFPFSWPANAEYLCDSGTEFEGLKIWGSPWSLWFDGINPHCTAFTGTEEDLDKKFKMIPEDTDILITHGPPYGILDKARNIRHVGSKALAVRTMAHLKLFIFGHIHEGYGEHWLGDTHLINASHMNAEYDPVNPPITFEI